MAEQYKDTQLVYAGQTYIKDKKLMADVWYHMDENGLVIEDSRALLPVKKTAARLPGGVYGNVSYLGESYRVAGATFLHLYSDQIKVMEWRALTDVAHKARAIEKKEELLRKGNPYEADMLNIRAAYSRAVSRYDYEAQAAIEYAVLRALKTPLRKTEK